NNYAEISNNLVSGAVASVKGSAGGIISKTTAHHQSANINNLVHGAVIGGLNAGGIIGLASAGGPGRIWIDRSYSIATVIGGDLFTGDDPATQNGSIGGLLGGYNL